VSAAFGQVLGSVDNVTAGQTTTVISPSSKTVTSGNTIVVGWMGYFDITPSGVTDNLGNTYSRVERVLGTTYATSDLWYAPVTSGGSITTITVSHASTQYVAAGAVEISGVAASPAVGGGTGGSGGSSPGTLYGVNNKTIPAGGLAIWAGCSTLNTVHTVGAASGSPSTTPVLDSAPGGGSGITGSLSHAVSASGVTAFSGGTVAYLAGNYSGAGAIFSQAGCVWTTPADTVSMSTTPDLKFNSPVSASKQHFYMQLDTANTFDTGNLRTYDSSSSQTNWTYWDGASWTALPSDGLPIAKSGNEIDYTVTSALSSATWYRRVRAGTLA
jgi:hypothetical protein